jgi:hypothetical protein
LAVPCSESGPQEDVFRNHGRHRMRWLNSGRFQKKPSAGASNNGRIYVASVCVCVCVCVCSQGFYFEGYYVSVVICPTLTVLHHISGNVLTAPLIARNMDKVKWACRWPVLFIH